MEKKSIVLSKWKERGPRGGQPETKSIEHPRPNLWPPPFKVPEHHVMLGTVQDESWFNLPHCFLQLDGHWTILVFPVHFLPTFLPEMWRVKLCLQAGRPGLWFYFCQQLCDLGLHFSIPPSSVSLLNGKQSKSNRHKARRIEPGDFKVPFLFIIQQQCIPGGPLAACYLEAKPTFNICSFIALPTPLPVYFTFPMAQIWFCPPRWQMMYYMHSLLRNVNLTQFIEVNMGLGVRPK